MNFFSINKTMIHSKNKALHNPEEFCGINVHGEKITALPNN